MTMNMKRETGGLTPPRDADSVSAIAAKTDRRPYDRARFRMARWLPALALTAGAARAEVGFSLGLLLPADRLSGKPGPLSAPLRPAPSVGLHAGREPGGGWGAPGWEVCLEAAQFESDADRRVRLFWVPLRAGPSWEVAVVEGATLTVGAAAGGALISARAGGDSETAGAGFLTASGRVRRALARFTASLGIEAGAAWQEGWRPMMAVRLRLDAGGE